MVLTELGLSQEEMGGIDRIRSLTGRDGWYRQNKVSHRKRWVVLTELKCHEFM